MNIVNFNKEKHLTIFRHWWNTHLGVDGPHERLLHTGLVVEIDGTPVLGCFLIIDHLAKYVLTEFIIGDPERKYRVGKAYPLLLQGILYLSHKILGANYMINIITQEKSIIKFLKMNNFTERTDDNVSLVYESNEVIY